MQATVPIVIFRTQLTEVYYHHLHQHFALAVYDGSNFESVAALDHVFGCFQVQFCCMLVVIICTNIDKILSNTSRKLNTRLMTCKNFVQLNINRQNQQSQLMFSVRKSISKGQASKSLLPRSNSYKF